MTEEEIRNRILVCEQCEMNYREVGNIKSANRFNNERHKWEKLLDKLNPKMEQELKVYKRGYYKQKERIDKAIEYINDNLIISSILDGKKYYTLNNYSFDYRELLEIIEDKPEKIEEITIRGKNIC